MKRLTLRLTQSGNQLPIDQIIDDRQTVGNPFLDLSGFLIHPGEVFDPDATDHPGLRGRLAKNAGIAEFLYYNVVK